MHKMTSLLVVLAIALYAGWQSFFIVDETQLAIVTQFGEYRYSVHHPGIYRKWPFLQKVHHMERRILGSDTMPSELLTLDKKRIVADPITRWRMSYLSLSSSSPSSPPAMRILFGPLA